MPGMIVSRTMRTLALCTALAALPLGAHAQAPPGVEPVRPCLGGDRCAHGRTSFSPVAVVVAADSTDVSATAAARLIAAR